MLRIGRDPIAESRNGRLLDVEPETSLQILSCVLFRFVHNFGLYLLLLLFCVCEHSLSEWVLHI